MSMVTADYYYLNRGFLVGFSHSEVKRLGIKLIILDPSFDHSAYIA